MPLFKRKKKEEKEKKEEISPLPEFPKFPKQEFPTYERELQIKPLPIQERAKPPEEKPEEFGIPSRRPSISKLAEEPTIREEEPAAIERLEIMEEKPLFVKIEKYKEAINTINQIKAKIQEAERVLGNLNKIKAQEDRQLESWQTDINRIKEKLISIDKKLFGV